MPDPKDEPEANEPAPGVVDSEALNPRRKPKKSIGLIIAETLIQLAAGLVLEGCLQIGIPILILIALIYFFPRGCHDAIHHAP